MTLRKPRERILQTLAYESGGLIITLPAYLGYVQVNAAEGIEVVMALMVAALGWTPLHNIAFDWLDRRLSGRLASDRPHRWRVVHALSTEVTMLVVTLPILMLMGRQTLPGALAISAGLTAIYVAYGYVFHLIFDRLRPMVTIPAAPWPLD